MSLRINLRYAVPTLFHPLSELFKMFFYEVISSSPCSLHFAYRGPENRTQCLDIKVAGPVYDSLDLEEFMAW